MNLYFVDFWKPGVYLIITNVRVRRHISIFCRLFLSTLQSKGSQDTPMIRWKSLSLPNFFQSKKAEVFLFDPPRMRISKINTIKTASRFEATWHLKVMRSILIRCALDSVWPLRVESFTQTSLFVFLIMSHVYWHSFLEPLLIHKSSIPAGIPPTAVTSLSWSMF